MKKTLSFFILFLASVMLAGVFTSAASARAAEKLLRPIGGDPQPVPTPGGTGYSDVSPDAWYHGSVEYVSKTGLMVGVSEDIFDPNGKLTRAMTVTVLYRLAGSPATEGKGPFSDVPDGEWYSEPVKWASRKGVTLGVSETAFDPNGIITRADFATMLYRNGVSGDRFRTDASGEKMSRLTLIRSRITRGNP
ncbi:MAG: S-layer homology domain-containing protein [Clostridia bacterium]|nr:S-layer homology domain-containing protein [Clostridia bacterium]